MYREILDFTNDWTNESSATLQIFEAIPENKKAEKPNENIRSLERLAWHITQTLTEMPNKAGLIETDFLKNEPVPPTIADIIQIFKKQGLLLEQSVKDKWADTDLATEVTMYDENWAKGKVLSVLVKHLIHHRGQMTVIMRLLDIKVPGIYGPSKEEWIKYGMAAME